LSPDSIRGHHHAQKPSSAVTDHTDDPAHRGSLSLSTQQSPLNTSPPQGRRSVRSDFAMAAPRDAPEPDSP
jgi:hypothetical protein